MSTSRRGSPSYLHTLRQDEGTGQLGPYANRPRTSFGRERRGANRGREGPGASFCTWSTILQPMRNHRSSHIRGGKGRFCHFHPPSAKERPGHNVGRKFSACTTQYYCTSVVILEEMPDTEQNSHLRRESSLQSHCTWHYSENWA